MLVDVLIVDIQCKLVTESCHGRRSFAASTTSTDERRPTRLDVYAASVDRCILIVRTLQMKLETVRSVSSCLCLQQRNKYHLSIAKNCQ